MKKLDHSVSHFNRFAGSVFTIALAFATSTSHAGSCDAGMRPPKPPVCKPAPKPICKPVKKYTPKRKMCSSRKPAPPVVRCYCSAPPQNQCTDNYRKTGLLSRLQNAPTNAMYYNQAPLNSNQAALLNLAYSSQNVRMLGRVSFQSGASWITNEAKQGIDKSIMEARPTFGPNAMVVVMGFADKSGRYESNLRISNDRARNVQAHLNELNWKYGLQLQSDAVAMGEENELCGNDLSHHRIAEIWMVDGPIAVPAPAPTRMNIPNQLSSQTPQSQIQGSSVPTSAHPYVTAMPSGLPGQPIAQGATPQPVPANPLLGLIQYLEQNVVLAEHADRNEFAQQLNLLKQIGAQ